MRFLVTTRHRHPVPPEVALGLLAAMRAFREKYADKAEQDRVFAGVNGGGAIMNVDSHEELDEIMGEMPFAPFSDVETRAISDLDTWLETSTRQLEAMVQGTPR